MLFTFWPFCSIRKVRNGDGVPKEISREVQILKLSLNRDYLQRKTKNILYQKVDVVDEQMWTGSSGGERGNIHMYIYIYIHTHTYIYIYSTPDDPAPLHKVLSNTVFLSITPTFASLLEKVQHENS